MQYVPKYKKKHKSNRPGAWKLGKHTDILTMDKYYAWLKHRAQAKYRGESYSLTFEDWQTLWPNEQWLQRGRTRHSLCLMLLDPEGGWHFENVDVVERIVYLGRASEYQEYSNAKS